MQSMDVGRNCQSAWITRILILLITLPLISYLLVTQGVIVPSLIIRKSCIGSNFDIPLEEDDPLAHLKLTWNMSDPLWIENHDTKDTMCPRKFAIISSSLSSDAKNRYNYAFPLPLTVLAWQRLGFRTIVILVGRKEIWTSDPAANYIYDELVKYNPLIVFLDSPEDAQTMNSQTSRIFLPALLGKFQELGLDDYVITSDADLWPIDHQSYDLPASYDIVSLNAFCCGQFLHKGSTYTMLPMANIGMRVNTLMDIIVEGHPSNEIPLDIMGIKTYLREMFGDVVDNEVVKGENLGWYLDQRTASILIADVAKAKKLNVKYIKRNVGTDRIDRSRWNPTTLCGQMDAHILEHCYRNHTWNRMMPLIKLIFPSEYGWALKYQARFNDMID